MVISGALCQVQRTFPAELKRLLCRRCMLFKKLSFLSDCFESFGLWNGAACSGGPTILRGGQMPQVGGWLSRRSVATCLLQRQALFSPPALHCLPTAPKWILAWHGGVAEPRWGQGARGGAAVLFLCPWASHWLSPQLAACSVENACP